MTTKVIPAAGGVVWRENPDRTDAHAAHAEPATEVLVVHRPKYDDWTLPKGKLEPDEHVLSAAVREVGEESGVHAAPQVRLPRVRYLTGLPDVEKTVDYWSMRCLNDGGHKPTDEIDMVEWMSPAAARERLTYVHDRGTLAAFLNLPPVAGVVVLLRHASAGRRGEWSGPDEERPLDANGRRDAARTAGLLSLFAPCQIVSAPVRRCVESVADMRSAGANPSPPIAPATIGSVTIGSVTIDDRFVEGADVAAARAALRDYASANPATVVCTQGDLLRSLMPLLRAEAGVATGAVIDTPKDSGWALAYPPAGRLIAVDRFDPREAPV